VTHKCIGLTPFW